MEEFKPVKIAPKNWHSVKRKIHTNLYFSLSLFLCFYLFRSHSTLNLPSHTSQISLLLIVSLFASQMSCRTTCLQQIKSDVLTGNNNIKIYKHNIAIIIIAIGSGSGSGPGSAQSPCRIYVITWQGCWVRHYHNRNNTFYFCAFLGDERYFQPLYSRSCSIYTSTLIQLLEVVPVLF